MMNTYNSNLMLPEEALNRFQKPDTALLGLDISTHDNKQARYGFKVNDIGFLVASDILCEFMKNIEVYPVPNTQTWLHGLVNLRGNLIPVYDLPLLLGLSEIPMEHHNLLIIDNGPDSVGILVKDLPRPCHMRDWAKLSHVPELPAGLSECVSDAYSNDDVIWLEFDHKVYFSNVMIDVAS